MNQMLILFYNLRLFKIFLLLVGYSFMEKKLKKIKCVLSQTMNIKLVGEMLVLSKKIFLLNLKLWDLILKLILLILLQCLMLKDKEIKSFKYLAFLQEKVIMIQRILFLIYSLLANLQMKLLANTLKFYLLKLNQIYWLVLQNLLRKKIQTFVLVIIY
ncbi:MAG: hypothetical protein EBT95_10600 [Verrucomicrobia bacterium]|nr:hypothetical protein [Verrucomicrobiota bacterium]